MKQLSIALCNILVAMLMAATYLTPAHAQVDSDGGIPEIVVTAQKREQNLQNVSISISALSQDLMESLSLKNGRDLSNYVPGLTITSQYNSSQPYIYIRGVGTRSFAASDTGAVGVYTDEIFLSALSGQTLQMFDLARVEVLRGPQGTLFGKNTTGGVISFISNAPTGKTELTGSVTYGRFNQVDVDGAAELPIITDKLSARFSFGYKRRDGILRNTFLNRDEDDVGNFGARLMVSATPSDALRIMFRLHYSKNDSGPLMYQQQGLLPGGTDAFGYVEDPDPYKGAWDRRDKRDLLVTHGFAMKAEGDLANSTLTSISAYEWHKRTYREEVDSSPVNYINDDFLNETSQFTQEVRLTSTTPGPLEWLVGGFYFHENIDATIRNELFQVLADFGVPFNPSDLFSGPFAAVTSFAQKTDSVSGFAHLTYSFSPVWAINTGLRYTDEEKKVPNVSLVYSPSFAINQPSVDGGSRTGDYSQGELSGHAALEFRPNNEALLYSRFSRGYRSGGFNGAVFFSIDEFAKVKAEFVDAVEVGAKTTWLNKRLIVNASAFHNSLTDMQLTTVQSTPDGGVRSVLDNAGQATTYGLEIEAIAQPTSRLFARASIALLHTKFDKYINGSGEDLSGERLTNSPERTFNALAQYSFSLPSEWSLLPQISVNYTSDVDYEIGGVVGQKAYWLGNARLAVLNSTQQFEMALEVKNVADKRYYSDAFDLPAFGFNAYSVADCRASDQLGQNG